MIQHWYKFGCPVASNDPLREDPLSVDPLREEYYIKGSMIISLRHPKTTCAEQANKNYFCPHSHVHKCERRWLTDFPEKRGMAKTLWVIIEKPDFISLRFTSAGCLRARASGSLLWNCVS